MATRKILNYKEPALHKHCREVTDFDARLATLLDDMRETLDEADGVGLAAPQVGIRRRAVLVLETNVEKGQEPYFIELVNPVIIAASGEQEGAEGCLSVPGEYGIVKRPMDVTVKAQDRRGEWFEVSGTGLTARAFCHELDHLEGRIFTELASRMLTPEELAGDGDEDEDGEAEE